MEKACESKKGFLEKGYLLKDHLGMIADILMSIKSSKE